MKRHRQVMVSSPSTPAVLTPWRLRVYPVAALIGLTIGLLVFVATSDGLRTITGGRIGGDLPAFYGAARIVRAGMVASLYDPATQRQFQAGLLPGVAGQPGKEDGWIHFAYPPFFAVWYVPLTFFSFATAYVIHTAFMAACCVAALALLRPHVDLVRRHFLPCVAASLTFYPLFRAIAGGQNTALSLLCAAGAAAAAARRRDLTAGLWIGFWMFKPQLAIPVGVVLILCGHPKVVIGAGAAAAVWYLLGAALAGFAWPLWWWREGVVPFVAADLLFDRGNGVSFKEVAFELGVPALGWLAILLTATFVMKTAWRRGSDAVALVGMTAAAAVLMSPHALYYEGGLAVLALVTAANVRGAAPASLLVLVWILAQAHVIRGYLPLPPITIVLGVALVLAARAKRAAGLTACATTTSD